MSEPIWRPQRSFSTNGRFQLSSAVTDKTGLSQDLGNKLVSESKTDTDTRSFKTSNTYSDMHVRRTSYVDTGLNKIENRVISHDCPVRVKTRCPTPCPNTNSSVYLNFTCGSLEWGCKCHSIIKTLSWEKVGQITLNTKQSLKYVKSGKTNLKSKSVISQKKIFFWLKKVSSQFQKWVIRKTFEL